MEYEKSDGLSDQHFITCSQCLEVIQPYLTYEVGDAMISNYHCDQCCYSFSIYSITKDKLAEIKGISVPMEMHEMEDK